MKRYIGIDPDLRKSGIAMMEDGDFVSIFSMGIVELTGLFQKYSGDPDTVFVLEDVNALKPTFARRGANETVMKSIAQKVGMVKAIAEVLVQFLIHYECAYELRVPMKGFAKRAKEDAKFFNRLTGWEGRTNSDMRDAAMLIYRFRER